MQKFIWGLGVLLLAGCGIWLGKALLVKPAPAAAGPAQPAEITYLCRETGELVRAAPQKAPAVNPRTGRATLVPALFCTQCNSWQAAPPPELRDRYPVGPVCRVHRVGLLAEAPTGAAPR